MNPDVIDDDISKRIESMKKASFHYNWFTMLGHLGEAWFYFKRAVKVKLKRGYDDKD